MYQLHHSVSIYYSLICPYITYGCTLWGNNYRAPLSQTVKLTNKQVRIIDDVPLMEPITPHYVSLGSLKFPDIVKLNTCLLFYDYFNNDKFATLPVSLVFELHNYNVCSASTNQLFITSFRTNLRRFCPTVIGNFFTTTFLRQLRTNLLKECLEKHSINLTLLNIDVHFLAHY